MVRAAAPSLRSVPLHRHPFIDQRAGVRLPISHLVALGHRRVLHVAGPSGWDEVDSRLHAYQSELRLAGLPCLPPLFGDWSAARW